MVDGSLTEQILSLLQEQGFFTYLLPFLLIFAIVYALLLELAIFGRSSEGKLKGKKVSAIIALVSAFYTINFPPFASFVQSATSFAAILLVITLFALMTIGFITTRFRAPGEAPFEEFGMLIRYYSGWVAGFLITLAVIVFVTSGGVQFVGGFGVGAETVTTVIIVIVLLTGIGLFIRWLMRPGWEDEAQRIDLKIEELQRKQRRAAQLQKQTLYDQLEKEINFYKARRAELERTRKVLR